MILSSSGINVVYPFGRACTSRQLFPESLRFFSFLFFSGLIPAKSTFCSFAFEPSCTFSSPYSLLLPLVRFLFTRRVLSRALVLLLRPFEHPPTFVLSFILIPFALSLFLSLNPAPSLSAFSFSRMRSLSLSSLASFRSLQKKTVNLTRNSLLLFIIVISYT